MARIIHELQDLTYLRWSHIRGSSGTAGTFLKSESSLYDKKRYYKLSNYDSINGVIGHESINEIIVDRLLTVLGVEHLEYELINALIEVDGVERRTYICSSIDYKEKGESKIPLDDYYRVNSFDGEGHYDFCKRMGWQDYIDKMIIVDYLILNRDRHGANIEVLRNSKNRTIRLAPLFDHGLSLLYSCYKDEQIEKFDIMEDRRCQNFIGSYSCFENLSLINGDKDVLKGKLKEADRDFIFDGLDEIISEKLLMKIWNMIYKRYKIYEDI